MTYKEVYTMLGTAGIPVAYNQFSNATPKEPPFICFLFNDSDDLIADNYNYQPIRTLRVELYTDYKDFELEQTVENIFITNKIPFDRDETYLDSERMYMIVYEADIVITEEINNG